MIGLQKYGNDESPWWEKKSEEIAKAGQRKGCQESEKKTNKTKIKNKTKKNKIEGDKLTSRCLLVTDECLTTSRS